ncbi:MAG: ABC transporter ATP-binding protein [Synergistaceae bacterium]|nr:ABC transporter ATP-binding protein [Synergistaceae bacterium]
MSLLKLDNISKEYERGGKKFFAVNNASLEINQGDYVNITGRSGSGKSTLLNIAAGMLSPSAGSVELDGELLTGKSDKELSLMRNNKIGFIPQGFSALNYLTVTENILLPFYLYKNKDKNFEDAEGWARILLERFNIDKLAEAYPNELSGGELRRVVIARALINRPKIIIADEPTADLDLENINNIMQIFKNLNEQDGVTLLIVSHDQEALSCGKRLFIMSDGILNLKN